MFLNGEGRLLAPSLASLRNEWNVISEISLQFLHTLSPFFLFYPLSYRGTTVVTLFPVKERLGKKLPMTTTRSDTIENRLEIFSLYASRQTRYVTCPPTPFVDG